MQQSAFLLLKILQTDSSLFVGGFFSATVPRKGIALFALSNRLASGWIWHLQVKIAKQSLGCCLERCRWTASFRMVGKRGA